MSNDKDPELQTVTPVETEETGTYDPFAAAKEMDDAVIAGRDSDEPAPAEPQPAEQPKAEENNAPQEEEPAAEAKEAPAEQPPEDDPNRPYTAEEIAQLEALARKAIQYDDYFSSEEGKQVVDYLKSQAQAKGEKAQQTAEPEVDAWEEMNQNIFGEGSKPYLDAFNRKVNQIAEKVIAEKLGGTIKEAELVKQNRIAREKDEIANSFANHIQEAYGMDTSDAQRIATLAVRELSHRMPNFNRDAYLRELSVFADTELASVNAQMIKNRQAELDAMKAELEEYRNGTRRPQAPSSTAVAADRTLLDSKNADYKRGGSIPSGRGGSVDPAESEDEAALKFFGRG